MHVEALRVHEDDEGCLRADAAQFDDPIEALVTINGCAGFRTIEIDGFPGRWLVNILPMS